MYKIKDDSCITFITPNCRKRAYDRASTVELAFNQNDLWPLPQHCESKIEKKIKNIHFLSNFKNIYKIYS